MSPKVVDKNVRKDEILSAAMRIIAQKGYRDVKIADIAHAAGIGKGTVYEYFTSKEEIFAAAFDKFKSEVEQVQIRKMRNRADPADRLKALIDSWIEVLNNESFDYLELLTDFWAEGIRSKDSVSFGSLSIAKVYSDYRTQVMPIIEKGIKNRVFRTVDPLYTAAVLLGALDGLILQWMLDKKTINIVRFTETLYDLFMHGIAVERG